ncbi:MAG: cupin domain-containing protein [Deltaproteobacteria bacterium]|nr:cupin domain-containing protein [Deltaproteobacteria bacterium]
MIYRSNESGFKEVLPGIQMKTLVHGDKTLLAEFHLKKGAELPLHRHPHEQSGYLVSGLMELTAGGQVYRLGAGDSWCLRGDLEHGAKVLEDCIAIEVFAPRRDEYITR